MLEVQKGALNSPSVHRTHMSDVVPGDPSGKGIYLTQVGAAVSPTLPHAVSPTLPHAAPCNARIRTRSGARTHTDTHTRTHYNTHTHTHTHTHNPHPTHTRRCKGNCFVDHLHASRTHRSASRLNPKPQNLNPTGPHLCDRAAAARRHWRRNRREFRATSQEEDVRPPGSKRPDGAGAGVFSGALHASSLTVSPARLGHYL